VFGADTIFFWVFSICSWLNSCLHFSVSIKLNLFLNTHYSYDHFIRASFLPGRREKGKVPIKLGLWQVLCPYPACFFGCAREAGRRDVRSPGLVSELPAPAGKKLRQSCHCGEVRCPGTSWTCRGWVGEGWLPPWLWPAPRNSDSPQSCCESHTVSHSALGCHTLGAMPQIRQRMGSCQKGEVGPCLSAVVIPILGREGGLH
jgi:hypothetical protein